MPLARPLLTASLIGLVAAALSTAASAQQVYRSVGPEGRVTFSDKPLLDPNARASAPTALRPAAGGEAGAGLPFELREVVSRFPVTLYTGANCDPCSSGRAFLTGRGIPFTEKTVATSDDITALQRLGGAGLPFMTIGGQQIKGYSQSEWSQFLDAAGYPKVSQLPAGYRPPTATPLVAVQAPVVPSPVAEPSRAAAPAPEPTAGPGNPAGIRF